MKIDHQTTLHVCDIEGIALGHAVRHSQESHVLRDFLSVEVDDGLIVGHDVARDRCDVG